MALTIGTVGKFEPAQEQWTQCMERLTHLFAANGVKDKKAVLFAVIGYNVYKLLCILMVHAMVEEKSYKDIIDLIAPEL